MSIGSWSYEWAKIQNFSTDWLAQTQSTQTWAKDSVSFLNSENSLKLNHNCACRGAPAPHYYENPSADFHNKYFGNFEKVYFCDNQLSGRGQGTNTWSNPEPGSSLLSTWVFELKVSPPPFLTLKVGLALIRACQSTWPKLNWSLKAQNDLLLQDMKIAGLLLETVSQGAAHKLLIGLGFNVFNKPTEVKESTCLTEQLGRPIVQTEWAHFLSRLYMELQFLMQQNFFFKVDPVANQSMVISPEEKDSLLYYLNRNSRLTKLCIDIDDKGNMKWH
jgi:BirA family biotin operon repressor/biotin-[acetyl-CoA-carboxylase] ligase